MLCPTLVELNKRFFFNSDGPCRSAKQPQALLPMAAECVLQGQAAYCVAGEQRRYAIIGGGFAGVATAWHLLAHANSPVSIHLFDGAGIAGGASGAAAGLLHPYSPKGKVRFDPIPLQLQAHMRMAGNDVSGQCLR